MPEDKTGQHINKQTNKQTETAFSRETMKRKSLNRAKATVCQDENEPP